MQLYYDLMYDDGELTSALKDIENIVDGQLAEWLRGRIWSQMQRVGLDSRDLGDLSGDKLAKLARHTNAIVLAAVIHTLRQNDITNYLVWTRHQHTKMTAEVLNASQSPDDVAANLNMYYQTARWFLRGRRIFDVAPGLAERLRYTEVRGLRGQDLRLPYDSLYLMVPEQADLWVYNPQTGNHRLRAIYMTEELAEDDVRSLKLVALGSWTEKHGYITDDAISHLHLQLPDDRQISDSIETSMQKRQYLTSSYLPELRDMWRQLYRWIANVLYYATSSDARVSEQHIDPRAAKLRAKLAGKKGRKRQAILDKLKGVDQRRYVTLGAGVAPLDPELRQKLATGRHLSVRYMRMGHWRRQPYGPGRQERKRIWIEPHWVGPLGAMDQEKKHLVR